MSEAALRSVDPAATAGPWPRNRRADPRTDRLHSLRNLLRQRARKHGLPLVVLGNSEDMLVAASEENEEARRVLARASRKSGRLPRLPCERDHSSHRFRVGDQELVLVIAGPPSGAHGATPGMLEQVLLGAMAERVRRIFNEPNAPRPRGDEAPLVHCSGRLPGA
ncbi:MAG: hypothetical protein D6731_24185 [Planctomycetota bacterium]|nr:MAG: hypothetical protein D6731_24185 [Planctomycetota bacterium]